jgi:hypothetical protein
MEEERKIINGENEQAVWAQIEADLTQTSELFTYDALINQGSRQIHLYIDIDLGGGFESGSAITELSAPVSVSSNFRFAVHDEDFLDSIGSFLGLDSTKTGYPELDEKVVIKTNSEIKAREVLKDPQVRDTLSVLEDFDLGIHTHTLEETGFEQPYLEFNINEAITEPAQLRQVYQTFCKVLSALEN